MASDRKLTPMMQQYMDIKQKYPNTILFFRLGDFYETFYEDAKLVAKELEIVLTVRDKKNNVPMAGVPYHALNGYLSKLIKKGYSVTICDQVEDPKQAKGIVKREVIRTITPGTIIEDGFLDDKTHNFIVGLSLDSGIIGLCYSDLSTADFNATQFPYSPEKLEAELIRLKPSEIIMGPNIKRERRVISIIKRLRISIGKSPDGIEYDFDYYREIFKNHFKDLKGKFQVQIAGGILLDYLKKTQLSDLKFLKRVSYYEEDDFIILDAATFKNLELLESFSGDRRATLYYVLDKTITPMGGRLLKKWISFPLLDLNEIIYRQSIIREFIEHMAIVEKLQEELKKIGDLDRILSRLELNLITPKDVLILKHSLKAVKYIKGYVASEYAYSLTKNLDTLDDLVNLLDRALYDNLEGIQSNNLIRDGFSKELDEYKAIVRDSKRWLATLELREREKTGIKNLKVKFNKVFGYYIEVTKVNLNKVPDYYIRKQTIANGERYFTQELKEKEAIILGSEECIKEIEDRIFKEILEEIREKEGIVRKNSFIIAKLDAILSLARVARDNDYICPEFNEDLVINIKNGRHPVVERMLDDDFFTPNDTLLDNQNNRLVILTGPNMAGKSTYIRQVALICLMAQMGSFIPAESANLCIVDKIFTRVGASDNLAKGESTFMVEMKETANILRNATYKSLIILDEIGRGTSTYDGLAIAWAVAEFVNSKGYLGAKTLFATHYHELTYLENILDGVKNLSMAVSEEGEDVFFLHKVILGRADRSYGIEVARLAGLPDSVIERAKEILKTLESEDNNTKISNRLDDFKDFEITSQLDLFGKKIIKTEYVSDDIALNIIEDLKNINLDRTTPLRALEILYKWKRILKKGKAK